MPDPPAHPAPPGTFPAPRGAAWEPSTQLPGYRPPGWPDPQAPHRPRYALALVLLLLTFFTTTTLGVVWYLATRTDVTTDLGLWLSPRTVTAVWTDPALRAIGLDFSLAVLTILFCHEMGHYLACRRYRLAATLPYFLPLPIGWGTLGAFIRIRSPIRNKQELFDVGVAGPLAGFAALLPFLLYGVARSTPAPIAPLPPDAAPQVILLMPGKCLALELAIRLFHGELPPGMVLDLHPWALAAWFGLLATALNLIPLGQLDGGHILYAAIGRLQRHLAPPLWLGLGLLGLVWPGWFLWFAVVLVIGIYHPPVADESEPLSPGRRQLAWLALVLFILSFMPLPLTDLPVAQ